MNRDRLRNLIVQIVISIALLVFLFFQIQQARLCEIVESISIGHVLSMTLLLVPSLLIRAVRWKVLFDSKAGSISTFESLQLLFVGLSLNLFLPAGSGDIAKSYYGYKWSGIKERMLSISLLDKLIALGAVALIGMPFGIYCGHLLYVTISVSFLAVIFMLLLGGRYFSSNRFSKKFFEHVHGWVCHKINVLDVLAHIQVSYQKILWAVVLSVLGWLVTYYQFFGCFDMIGADVSMSFVLTVAPLITLARLFPLTFNGFGSDEMLLYAIFQSQGMTAEQILTAALLYRFIVILLPAFPGLWILVTKRRFHSLVHCGEEGIV